MPSEVASELRYEGIGEGAMREIALELPVRTSAFRIFTPKAVLPWTDE